MPATLFLRTRVRNGPQTDPLSPFFKIKVAPTKGEVMVLKCDENDTVSVVDTVRAQSFCPAC